MNAFTNRVQYRNLTKEEKEQFTSEAKKAGMYTKQRPDGTWTDASTKFGKFGERTVYRLKMMGDSKSYNYWITEEGTKRHITSTYDPDLTKEAFLVIPVVEPPSPECMRTEITWNRNGTPKITDPTGGETYISVKPIGWILQGWEFKGYSFSHLDKKDIRSKIVISSLGEKTYKADYAVFRKLEII